jgi:pentose-5-phosphate-3-epimerase
VICYIEVPFRAGLTVYLSISNRNLASKLDVVEIVLLMTIGPTVTNDP